MQNHYTQFARLLPRANQWEGAAFGCGKYSLRLREAVAAQPGSNEEVQSVAAEKVGCMAGAADTTRSAQHKATLPMS